MMAIKLVTVNNNNMILLIFSLAFVVGVVISEKDAAMSATSTDNAKVNVHVGKKYVSDTVSPPSTGGVVGDKTSSADQLTTTMTTPLNAIANTLPPLHDVTANEQIGNENVESAEATAVVKLFEEAIEPNVTEHQNQDISAKAIANCWASSAVPHYIICTMLGFIAVLAVVVLYAAYKYCKVKKCGN